MKKSLQGIVIVLIAFTWLNPSSMAYSIDVDRIPNGSVIGCSGCHGEHYSLNLFGINYMNAGRAWTTTLAGQDSDNDSYTNGVELQDPSGSWSQGQPDPGNPALVTNPGDANSFPNPATATPVPTATPTPATSSPTPNSTTTPNTCTNTGAWLSLPANHVRPNDAFWCSVRICNMGSSALNNTLLFFILEAYGYFFFAPGFSTNLEYYTLDIPIGSATQEVIPLISWPSDAGTGACRFYSAMTDITITEIIGEFDMVDFTWGY